MLRRHELKARHAQRVGEDLALATTLTALHLLGYRPKLDRYFPARGRVVSLPPYPWQRQKYPLKGAGKGRRRRVEGTDFRSSAPTLLGSRLDTAIRTFEVAVSPTRRGGWPIIG
jgi:acyl transferase domain-containing protein